nr:gamma carbonic anhydrase 1, mitochondrial [Tanacetum cinerariifolium]
MQDQPHDPHEPQPLILQLHGILYLGLCKENQKNHLSNRSESEHSVYCCFNQRVLPLCDSSPGDPKPFPPPMKLFKDMVETMGGAERLLNCDETKEENIAMDEAKDGFWKLFKYLPQGYDFLSLNLNNYNTTVWYSSMYTNDTRSGPLGMIWVPRSINLVEVVPWSSYKRTCLFALDNLVFVYVPVLRDVNNISIGFGTKIQDHSLTHVAKSNILGKVHPTVIGDNVTVSHSAILHGYTVEDEAFIDMKATLLDGGSCKEACHGCCCFFT